MSTPGHSIIIFIVSPCVCEGVVGLLIYCVTVYVYVKVSLVCGNHTEIKHVTEPQMCQYIVELSTPLICHRDSMLVFPTLTSDLQDAWDELEGLRVHNIVTDQVTLAAWISSLRLCLCVCCITVQ